MMISPVTHRRDLAAGAWAMLPWLIGVVPFGLVIGVSAAQAEIPTVAGWLTGPLIYAGSAQIATLDLLNAGAGAFVVIASALIINLRLVLYSATMAAHWRGTPWWWRLLAAYLLVDPSFVVGTDGYDRERDRRRGHAFYLGGAAALWVAWLVAIAVGAVAGSGLPAWMRLEFVIPLFLVGEAVGKARKPAQRRALLTGAAVAVLALAAPLHLGVALAIVAGVGAGMTVRTPAAAAVTTPVHAPTGASQ